MAGLRKTGEPAFGHLFSICAPAASVRLSVRCSLFSDCQLALGEGGGSSAGRAPGLQAPRRNIEFRRSGVDNAA